MNTSLRIKLLSLCIVGCLTVPSGAAFAGDPAAAAQFYQQASKAYEQGKYAEAAELLEKAYARDQNLIYKYNEVLAYQAMGKYDEALRILDAYEEPMLEDSQHRFSDIKKIHAQIDQAKAKAQAQAKATKAGANGPKDAHAANGEQKDASTGITEPPEKGPNILGWSLVGVGVVGLGAAGLFGSTVLISDVADRESCMESGTVAKCYADFNNPQAQLKQDQDTWSTHQTLTWVSLGVGIAALVGGGVVLYMNSQDETAPDMGATGDDAQVTLTPYVGAHSAGGVVNVSF